MRAKLKRNGALFELGLSGLSPEEVRSLLMSVDMMAEARVRTSAETRLFFKDEKYDLKIDLTPYELNYLVGSLEMKGDELSKGLRGEVVAVMLETKSLMTFLGPTFGGLK